MFIVCVFVCGELFVNFMNNNLKFFEFVNNIKGINFFFVVNDNVVINNVIVV